MKPRVYVSSTFEDLREYRVLVRDVIARLGLEDVAMEYYVAEEGRPLARCLRDVRECDLYVGLFGFRYGYVPRGESCSITELEYREAKRTGTARRIFLLSERARVAPSNMDSQTGEGHGGEDIKALRSRLRDEEVVLEFDTEADLRAGLAEALSTWKDSLKTRPPEPTAPRYEYLSSIIATLQRSEPYLIDLSCRTTIRRLPEFIRVPEELTPSGYDIVEEAWAPEARVKLELDSIPQVLGHHRSFALIGEPGSGKTTTLKYLCLLAAREAQEDLDASIPLFINLAEWPKEKREFGDLVLFEQRARGVPDVPFNRLLLLLDGLNEIDSDRYDERSEAIKSWLLRNPARLIVASRRRHYQRYPLPIPTVTIRELDQDRARRLICRHLGDNQGELLLQSLESAIDTHFVRNPYMLRLICKIHDELEGIDTMPRGQLFRIAVQVLYERERRFGKGLGISKDALIEACGSISAQMIKAGSSTSVSMEWVVKRLPPGIDVEALMQVGTQSSMVELTHEGRFMQFTHQLLLEYFAAEYLLQTGRFSDWLSPPRFAHGRRLSQRFDEVVRTLVGLDSSTSSLLKVCRSDPFLAVDALVANAQHTRDRHAIESISLQVVGFLGHKKGRVDIAAMEALSQLGEGAAPALLGLLGLPNPRKRRLAVRTLGRIGGKMAIGGVLAASTDANKWVRKEAQLILESLDDNERPLIQVYLRDTLTKLPQEQRRSQGMALASIWIGRDEDLFEQVTDAAGIDGKAEAWERLRREVEEEVELEPDEQPAETVLGDVEFDVLGGSWLAEWDQNPGDEGLERRGQRWLRSAPLTDPSWTYVWKALWDYDSDNSRLTESALKWISSVNPRHPGWALVWTSLWKKSIGDGQLAFRGRSWLEGTLQHPSWAFVWTSLWAWAVGDPDLDKTARRWLRETGAESSGWPLVWTTLARFHDKDDSLEAQGRGWLQESAPQSDGWGYVWPILWDWNPGDTQLLTLGRWWLDQSLNGHPGWTYIWERLYQYDPHDQRITELTQEWLREVPSDSDAWPFVYGPLVKFNPRDLNLQKVGRRWLVKMPLQHRAWGRVWLSLRKVCPKESDLREMAQRWLDQEEVASNPSFGLVWSQLWKEGKKDPDFEKVGRNLLREGTMEHLSWGSVWCTLWDTYPGDSELIERGLTWVQTVHESHFAWSLIWTRLLSSFAVPGARRTKLEQRGYAWLMEAPLESKSWSYVWEGLWKRRPNDSKLKELGLRWLNQTQGRHRAWTFVWEALYKQIPDDPEIIQAGARWLEEVPPHKRWGLVWKALADRKPLLPSVVNAAVRWLRAQRAGFFMPLLWRTLSDAGELPDDLRGYIKDKFRELDEISAHTGDWARLWIDLWKTGLGRTRLLERAFTWLPNAPFSLRQWPFVWRDALRKIKDRESMITLGKRWLEGRSPEVPGWALVWLAVSQSTDDNAELVELGWAWMNREFRHRSTWSEVWLHLWETQPTRRDQLTPQADRWLEAHSSHPKAKIILESINGYRSDDNHQGQAS